MVTVINTYKPKEFLKCPSCKTCHMKWDEDDREYSCSACAYVLKWNKLKEDDKCIHVHQEPIFNGAMYKCQNCGGTV